MDILKMDVRKYFQNIGKEILYNVLKKKIKKLKYMIVNMYQLQKESLY